MPMMISNLAFSRQNNILTVRNMVTNDIVCKPQARSDDYLSTISHSSGYGSTQS